jgi:hypothetical protein
MDHPDSAPLTNSTPELSDLPKIEPRQVDTLASDAVAPELDGIQSAEVERGPDLNGFVDPEAVVRDHAYEEAKACLARAAKGEKLDGDRVTVKVSPYAHALMTVLAHEEHVSRGKLVEIALSFLARQTISRPVTSQNDLAVQIQSMELAVWNAGFELMELNELTLDVMNQESTSGYGSAGFP